MKIVTLMCGACSPPPGAGHAARLDRRERKRPSSSVGTRPKPLKPGSSGLSCVSSGCAYLPCALACQISTSASLTGLPSPSRMRPSIVICSPVTPGADQVVGDEPREADVQVRADGLRRGGVQAHGIVLRQAGGSCPSASRRGRAARCRSGSRAPVRESSSPSRTPRPAGWRARSSGNARVHRIVLEQRIAGEIHLRHEPRRERRPEQRKMDVRRPPRVVVVAPRILAGLDRDEAVAALGVGQRAAAAGEIGIDRRVVVVARVRIAAGGVGLPDLDQRVRRPACRSRRARGR